MIARIGIKTRILILYQILWMRGIWPIYLCVKKKIWVIAMAKASWGGWGFMVKSLFGVLVKSKRLDIVGGKGGIKQFKRLLVGVGMSFSSGSGASSSILV